MGSRILVFLVVALIQVCTTTPAVTNNDDFNALKALKDVWENVPPTWAGIDPCGSRWDGILCTNSRVTSITLASMGLKGTLSGDISNLSELQILDLSYNTELSGPLPPAIGNLKKLTSLYRKNRKDFFVGRVEKDVAPPRLSGEELHDVVSEYGDIVFGLQSGKQKFPGFGLTHNWVKRSIFWELPYWKTNLLCHNLDVMHIEKNVFENIFNTVMDVKGKTKDNIKARLDVALFCNRQNMELVFDESRVVKPRASFVLEKNAQLLVYKWLKSLCFPDGHASNISRLVKMEECRLYGMKSHDCHVFMQTLIPLAFRDLLPKGIWDALTEISHFFRDICSIKLNVDHIERLETNIVETLCKLEMIFPPSFFDSMKHLPIHLPFEAKVGGPVQYRWMYPFERYLFNLKKKVKNKAHVEASICEAYIVEEISTFISYYFKPHLRTRINRVPRHDDGGEVSSSGNLSIFSNPGRPTHKNAVRGRYLS